MLNYQKNLERYVLHRFVCEMKYSLLHLLIKEKIYSKVIDELVAKYTNEIKSNNSYFTRCYKSDDGIIIKICTTEDYITDKISELNTMSTLDNILNIWWWVDSIHGIIFWDNYYKNCKILKQKIK